MTEQLQPREVRDVEALRALAHPMRQRILRRLHQAGPATATTLARDLGENSGIMSYHLRLLAEHEFVREVAERGHGRERWWQVTPEPVWIPRDQLSLEARAEASGLQLPGWADALEGFERFRAARGTMGEWGRGTWAVMRTALTLTREEAAQLIADQQELIGRYRRAAGDAPAGARTVVFGFLAYPEAFPREDREDSDPRLQGDQQDVYGQGRSGQGAAVAADDDRRAEVLELEAVVEGVAEPVRPVIISIRPDISSIATAPRTRPSSTSSLVTYHSS
jgi:DNA-binding transcriptional ArsR family regulator